MAFGEAASAPNFWNVPDINNGILNTGMTSLMPTQNLAGYSALGEMPAMLSGGMPNSGGMSTFGKLNAGVAGLQTLGSLWMGFKAQKLAAKNFKLQKEMSTTNLANQMKSYNTALADRARSRGVMEGQSQATQDAYVSNNSLGRNQERPTGYADNYRGSAAPSASSLSSYSGLARPAPDREKLVG